MDIVYEKRYVLTDMHSDAFGRTKPAALLALAQDIAGEHATLLSDSWEGLQQKHLFWAVSRHRLDVFCPPKTGETLIFRTWPMVTTRVAYPRAVEGCREDGTLLFRVVSLWILMDTENRSLVLPGKGGLTIDGCNRGTEGSLPVSLTPGHYENCSIRTVVYSDLDRNQHMNNTRYLDWVNDLLPLAYHRDHYLSNCIICYHQELLPDQSLALSWQLREDGLFSLDGYSANSATEKRIFSAQVQYTPDVL